MTNQIYSHHQLDTEMSRWNFRWEEWSENAAEPFSRLTPEQRSQKSSVAGKASALLGKSGVAIGTAWRASIASPKHNSKTGELQRAAALSANHNARLFYICPRCGKRGKGVGMLGHINKGASRCPIVDHLEFVEPINSTQSNDLV
jgi:hypothetical protein